MAFAMVCDRYVATCSRLFYNVTTSQNVCSVLRTWVYTMATFGVVAHMISMIRLSFCGDNIIHHYFYDIFFLLMLFCCKTYLNELLVIFVDGFSLLATTTAIIISYAFILANILQIPSAENTSKAFSTWGSYFTAIGVFYGSIIFMYFKSTSSSSNMAREKVASVFYTSVIPKLNPLIYSLRNKVGKNVLREVRGKRYGPLQTSSQNH
ncbi:PREDICTED: olfactory receptor 8D4-like [Ceratotherium simum simum]|uniref:Olfactory receptor 8D4-like n=1 Tax=Ceratotherium simum simum TaxID=73337 RepID=A0ABM1DBH2_CERSS|nr:PREDICTED: olfactory receptor 8D4-like [Ceratotherium simum simum]